VDKKAKARVGEEERGGRRKGRETGQRLLLLSPLSQFEVKVVWYISCSFLSPIYAPGEKIGKADERWGL
jgi:hypothetical protein